MSAENEIRNVDLFGDIKNLKQDLFNAVHPVGEIYVQYPQQDDPATIYNKNGISSTWEKQTQYEGAFFRSEGGNAAAYIDKTNVLTKQEQDVMPHSHGMLHRHYVSGATGWMDRNASHYHYIIGTNMGDSPFTVLQRDYGYNHIQGWRPYENADWQDDETGYLIAAPTNTDHLHSFDGWSNQEMYDWYGNSGRHDTDNAGSVETRPINYTVVIWKRTN